MTSLCYERFSAFIVCFLNFMCLWPRILCGVKEKGEQTHVEILQADFILEIMRLQKQKASRVKSFLQSLNKD